MSNNQPSITPSSVRHLLKQAYYRGKHNQGYSDFELDNDIAQIESEKQEAYRQGQIDELRRIDPRGMMGDVIKRIGELER